MQDIAILVLSMLMIVLSISMLRLRNKVYMVQNRNVLFGVEFGAPLGEMFPVTKFKTINHEELSLLDDPDRKTILLITSLGCSVCKTLYPSIGPFSKKYGDKYRLVSLMLGDLSEIETLRNSHNLTNPIVHMTREDVRAIKTESYPFGYLLSSEGKVLAKGLVKDNDDLEILRNFKTSYEKKRKMLFPSFLRKTSNDYELI